MKKQKNNLKIIKLIFSLMLCVLTSACSDCVFSERCHREKEKGRILNMTKQQREYEKNLCIQEYHSMISITNHEKKQCNFWNCIDGKEELKKRLNNCLWRLKNININND
jgi:hypothetical protein